MADQAQLEKRRRPLGPEDHGLALRLDEFEAADFLPGYRYDLVDGRLEVSPEANLSHDRPLTALQRLLDEYHSQHPSAFDYLSPRSRVFPGSRRRRPGSVGPDLALFAGLREDSEQEWRDLEPVVVVEALSPGQEAKDLRRNRRVYAQVPSIREYWILDPRHGRCRLTLRVLSRPDWSEQLVPADGKYETGLFPGLVVDLSQPDLGLAKLRAVGFDRLRAEGRAELLRGLLMARFGPLPAQVEARLRSASLEEMVRWGRRLERATSLDELFQP